MRSRRQARRRRAHSTPPLGLVALVLLAALTAMAGGRLASQGEGGGTGDLPTPATFVTFVTEPSFRVPTVDVDVNDGASPGYILHAPKSSRAPHAAMITDSEGNLVWYKPVPKRFLVNNFRVQRYRGRPVLTWWYGRSRQDPHREGTYYIYNRRYEEIAHIRAGRGLRGNAHELTLTPRGTALIVIYKHERGIDLSPWGGWKNAVVTDAVIQEIDIRTGKVVFQWSALDHIPFDEAAVERASDHPEEPYDYVHVNSIALDRDGNILVSARYPNSVYKISRRTGKVLWTLSGDPGDEDSDFELGPGAGFTGQHDAGRTGGLLSIFDNGTPPRRREASRGILLRLSTREKTAHLVREFEHPDGELAETQGSMQVLPNGHVFIGWGSLPDFSEFDSEGRLVFQASYTEGITHSYRAYRFPWHGEPRTPPRATRRGGAVYVSWNGATEVAEWELMGGRRADRLSPLRSVDEGGFETRIELEGSEASFPYLAVRALDEEGRVLRRSKPLRPPAGDPEAGRRCVGRRTGHAQRLPLLEPLLRPRAEPRVLPPPREHAPCDRPNRRDARRVPYSKRAFSGRASDNSSLRGQHADRFPRTAHEPGRGRVARAGRVPARR